MKLIRKYIRCKSEKDKNAQEVEDAAVGVEMEIPAELAMAEVISNANVQFAETSVENGEVEMGTIIITRGKSRSDALAKTSNATAL